jgi:CopA family copper-resistance protein
MAQKNYSPHAPASGFTRRTFVTGLALGTASLGMAGPWSRALAAPAQYHPPQTLTGNSFNLDIGYSKVNFTGQERTAITANGTLPAPILRWKEGERVTLRVNNRLAEDSSIHWHGLILPSNMDGVPGLSFDGIKPGGYYEYSFDVQQSGTFWYHSHSGHQEQLGLYGAIVIDPKNPDPVAYDRDYVVLLSDWTDEDPHNIFRKLKIQPHIYNTNERTLSDLFREIRDKGVAQTWSDRLMWNQMRMSERDISDVTGYTYTFLMNGLTPAQGWYGQFHKGEKVRLRFINGSAMTIFDVGIPGLKMTVVAADGQNVEPVTVDDFRIGVAETYDVVVEPDGDAAYTLFAQAIDRSGYARGTLAPDPSMHAQIPEMDPSPVLTHLDMGMAHGEHGSHGGSANDTGEHGDHGKPAMDHSSHGGMDHSGHGKPAMDHSAHSPQAAIGFGSGRAGFGSNSPIVHAPTEFGYHVDMRAENPTFRLDDPGVGLRDHMRLYGRRVLTYADLRNLYPTRDTREPAREIQLHLTGNMSRYMWSFNGIPYSDAEPIQLNYGERVRVTLVNDTMMNHPIHLHGMWSELETGDPDRIPRKHTIIVQPGAKVSYLVTADARGRWAFHCHLLFHMAGMFREFRVL